MKSAKTRHSGRHCVMAMLLGTAIAALGNSPAQARTVDIPGQAIEDISRYCTVCWRNARVPVDRWGDCTQEVFRRLLERLPASDWSEIMQRDSEQRREFLRAIDAVKKQTQRQRHAVSYLEDVGADDRVSAEQERLEDREVWHRAAGALLSVRQQRILQLSCEGWSIADMAEELAVSPERISDEKYKAIQKLRQYFQGHPEWLS